MNIDVRFNKVFTVLVTILLLAVAQATGQKRDSLIVSLVTAAPGNEVYELCGHSALRIRSAEMDSVWNYGVFDFNKPNFVYRFVKGETDYMLAGYPFAWFMQEYAQAGREVREQELNLTQEESRRLLEMLRRESMPDRCTYRYNYVKDNCATRITARVSEATGQKILFPDSLGYGTFRREMRAFHRNYPWYQFGIDLALGTGIDYRLRADEEMFVPVVMSERYDGAEFADGRKLVRHSAVLLPDSGHASLPPTPWYLSPMTVAVALFIIICAMAVWMARKKRCFRWVYSLWFGITGLAGCLITFLVFVSEHEATNPNMLVLWLNPLQLLLAVCVWTRIMRPVANLMAWYNIIILGILLIVWPFQAQSANPAVFPLMGATLALAVVYAILHTGNSYNKKKEKHAKDSSVGGRGPRRPGVGSRPARRSKAPSGGRNRR